MFLSHGHKRKVEKRDIPRQRPGRGMECDFGGSQSRAPPWAAFR